MTNLPDITKFRQWPELQKQGFERVIYYNWGKKRFGIGCRLNYNNDEIITIEPYLTNNLFLKKVEVKWKNGYKV